MRCQNIREFNGNKVACGHCMACRVNLTSQWTLRMMYELGDWDYASFLTLNYSDDYFSWLIDQGRYSEVNNLSPKEVTGYFKRLRRYMNYYYDDFKGFKMYTAGEYGPKTNRAHYHSIVYGLNPDNDDHRDIMKFAWNEKRMPVPRNEDWQWDKSRGVKSAIGAVTPDSIRYVAGYVQKKYGGKMAKDVYGDRHPPFSQMSKGLGLHQASLHQASLQKGWTYLPGGKKIGIPRYYRDKFGIEVKIDEKVEAEIEEEQTEELFRRFCRDRPDILDIPISRRGLHFNAYVDDAKEAYVEKIWEEFRERGKRYGGQ